MFKKMYSSKKTSFTSYKEIVISLNTYKETYCFEYV